MLLVRIWYCRISRALSSDTLPETLPGLEIERSLPLLGLSTKQTVELVSLLTDLALDEHDVAQVAGNVSLVPPSDLIRSVHLPNVRPHEPRPHFLEPSRCASTSASLWSPPPCLANASEDEL